MLESANYKLTIIRKIRVPSTYGIIRRNITYPFRLLEGWIMVLFVLIKSSSTCIFHLSGFAGVTILNEFIIVFLVRLFNFRIVYELRGGGADNFYTNNSMMYRFMFRFILKHSNWILAQGEEIIPFIQRFTPVPVFHYPNCVEDYFIPNKFPLKNFKKINLLYYGRIEKDKNVDLIIEVASMVQKRFPNVYLTIIGNGIASYVEYIKKKMEDSLTQGTFVFREGITHEGLPTYLKDMHFYIFPSSQIREGQSNSVTECMSYGIIPIVSKNGFNQSTVGDSRFVVDSFSSKEYSSRIIEIIESGSFNLYSHRVYTHFINCFSQRVVYNKMLKIYKIIMDQ